MGEAKPVTTFVASLDADNLAIFASKPIAPHFVGHNLAFLHVVDVGLDLNGTVLAHVFERVESSAAALSGRPGTEFSNIQP